MVCVWLWMAVRGWFMPVTVLEKLGVSNDIVGFFKLRGLVVPERFRRRSDYLRSPSSEWFVGIADAYAPPLSSEEDELFRRSVRALSWKIVSGAVSLVEFSFFMKRAFDRVDSLEDSPERVAALYAILHLLHACLDYCYLKYDRHLEYHDYLESPVGYWFGELRRYSSVLGVGEKELLRGARRVLESTEELVLAGVDVGRLYSVRVEKELLVSRLLERLGGDAGRFLRVLDSVEELMDVQEIEGRVVSVRYEFLGGHVLRLPCQRVL